MDLDTLYADLERDLPIYDNPGLKPFVKVRGRPTGPIHDWFDFKEAFAPELVHWALKKGQEGRGAGEQERAGDAETQGYGNTESGGAGVQGCKGERETGRGGDKETSPALLSLSPPLPCAPAPRLPYLVVDPFAGSGTTVLACQMAGIDAVGIEYNPFFCFMSQAKLDWLRYDVERLASAVDYLLQVRGVAILQPPALSSFGRLFSTGALSDLLLIKQHILALDDPLTRRFLLLGLSAVLEPASAARKDGKGLRIARNGRPIRAVREILAERWRRMLDQLRELQAPRTAAQQAQARIIRGDARRLPLSNSCADLMVCSPPYLNSFDYTEVYKLEIWLLDFVDSIDEWRRLQARTLRSHVSVPVPDTDHRLAFEPLERLLRIVTSRDLWHPRLPAMFRGYFDDMYVALCEQARVLKHGAFSVLVVGNSSYAQVPIPTDVLLARIAELAGFRIEEIHVARHVLTSSQQLARFERARRRYLRESVIVLQRR